LKKRLIGINSLRCGRGGGESANVDFKEIEFRVFDRNFVVDDKRRGRGFVCVRVTEGNVLAGCGAGSFFSTTL
jgi:hypothetical protein